MVFWPNCARQTKAHRILRSVTASVIQYAALTPGCRGSWLCQRNLLASSYTQSGYPRLADDNYQTIDERCLNSFLEIYGEEITSPILDPCASPEGESALVTQLINKGYDASTGCLYEHEAKTIITNPPYKRDLVDKIAGEILQQVKEGRLQWAALLVRSGWDLAKKRQYLFEHPAFSGMVRLTFRPWWTASRKAQPIHGYQWVVLEHEKYAEFLKDDWDEPADVWHVYL